MKKVTPNVVHTSAQTRASNTKQFRCPHLNPNTPAILRNYLDAWNARQAEDLEVLLTIGTLTDRLRDCVDAGESLPPAVAKEFCDKLDLLQDKAVQATVKRDDAVTDLLHDLQYVGEARQAPAAASSNHSRQGNASVSDAQQDQEDDVGGLSDEARRACWAVSDAVELYMREAIANVPMFQAEYCNDDPGLIAAYVQSCAIVHAANAEALIRAAYCRCAAGRAKPPHAHAEAVAKATAAASGIHSRRGNASGKTV